MKPDWEFAKTAVEDTDIRESACSPAEILEQVKSELVTLEHTIKTNTTAAENNTYASANIQSNNSPKSNTTASSPSNDQNIITSPENITESGSSLNATVILEKEVQERIIYNLGYRS